MKVSRGNYEHRTEFKGDVQIDVPAVSGLNGSCDNDRYVADLSRRLFGVKMVI